MLRQIRPVYDFPPYRPPNEASSALIRVSRGCPWNKCLFCTMYKTCKFTPRSVNEIKRDIDAAVNIYKGAKTIFIADSDSLVMKDINEILRYIVQKFPKVERITSYARAKTLMKLGPERLKKIKKAGLSRIHVGLESGDKKTLEFMQKGATPDEMIAGGKAAKAADLELSFYILIGAGGKKRLTQHAQLSALVCNKVNPDFIRLRTLVVQHGSLLEEKMISGKYTQTSPVEKIIETKTFVEHLDVNNCLLTSDHFTNNIWVNNVVFYSGIFGVLAKEKMNMLKILNTTLKALLEIDGEIVDATILYDRGLFTSL
ncbi:MAG: radical SAM protein [Candidatus Thermoplasmatota archaeon]|nr:radical SAM protein [Candidatus Thermoplasmatota archaeon]MBU1940430.1 radical SAM protein [Candidatus Thermoplasmatota archaeon]